MASPQKENGFTPVANELFEALAKIRIPGESRQILDVIIRQTYGFNKSEDAISLSQFVLKTGLKKNATCKALNKLKSMNLITQKVNDIANIYRFNKDFSTWKPLPKKGTSTPKGEWGVPQKVKKYTPKGDIQKTITKDIITKDIERGDKSPPPAQIAKEFFNEEQARRIIGIQLAQKYNADIQTIATEIRKFTLYWTELNKSGTRQRWETEKTFEVSRRLEKWFSNIKQFNKTNKRQWN